MSQSPLSCVPGKVQELAGVTRYFIELLPCVSPAFIFLSADLFQEGKQVLKDNFQNKVKI